MNTNYGEYAQSAAQLAISKGHKDNVNLRELLIWTTSKSTVAMVKEYFAQHHSDGDLLAALIEISLEGEDMGDAPWAAANTIVDFPPELLREHEASLVTLSEYEWMYLNLPAQKALEKIKSFAK